VEVEVIVVDIKVAHNKKIERRGGEERESKKLCEKHFSSFS